MGAGFEVYFRSLAGSWSLERTISSGETLNGKAVFESISDTAFLMCETGTLTLLSGATIPASRNWYWHLKEQNKLEITYDAQRRQEYHLLDLNKAHAAWSANDKHLCGDDLYDGHYQFCAQQFEIKQTIKGPAKDYFVKSLYKRI